MSAHDDPSNVEWQSLVEAERILDEVKIEIRAGASVPLGMTEREIENYARHDATNYHECLAHVRARASSVRTVETATLILRSRVMRAVRAAYPAIGGES